MVFWKPIGRVSANTGAQRNARNRAARRVLIVLIVLEVRRAACPQIADLGRGEAGLGSYSRIPTSKYDGVVLRDFRKWVGLLG